MSVTNRPIRILFVCHGNICRSPMAEFIFKDMVRQVGLADQFEIASAATSREEIWHGKGNPVYPPAKAELAAHGLSCDGKRARQLTVADYDYYDLLLAMDGSNVRNLHRMLGGDPQHKIKKLLNYAHGGDVADPWYSRDFARALPACGGRRTAFLNGRLRPRFRPAACPLSVFLPCVARAVAVSLCRRGKRSKRMFGKFLLTLSDTVRISRRRML